MTTPNDLREKLARAMMMADLRIGKHPKNPDEVWEEEREAWLNSADAALSVFRPYLEELDSVTLVKDEGVEIISDLRAELDTLRARVAELEGALKPFASFENTMRLSCEQHSDGHTFYTFNSTFLTHGDFRTATRTLKGATHEGS